MKDKTLALLALTLAAVLLSGCPQSNSGDKPPTAATLALSQQYGKGGIAFIEFSDIQCPYCAKAHASVEKLRKEYEGRVSFVFKHYPLDSSVNPLMRTSLHPNAGRAAAAAEAAKKQGKLWEYLSIAYANQHALGDEQLVSYAEQLGIDREKFVEDMNSVETLGAIQRDIGEANAVGVRATPTFIINGRLVEGALPYEQLKKIVEEELAKK